MQEWCALYILTSTCALRHNINFQKWSEHGVFCICWLPNMFRAITARTFWTPQLPKVLRAKCASHHNGVQVFISHLASWLRARRFSEPTLRPSGATNHWKKHSVSWLSYLFAHLHLLSSDFLPVWSSPSLVFSLLIFSMPELLPGCAFHLPILSEL